MTAEPKQSARLSILLLGALLTAVPANAQVELFFEDFEDATIGYSPSVPDNLTNIAAGAYFGRIAPDTATLPADTVYTNLQGSGFYAVQDTDGTDSGDIEDIDLNITGVDISGATNLAFSFFVAEADATNGNEDWDTTSSLMVEFQIDGGGFNSLFAIESELGEDANETNELARVDTDFDGTGDGEEITPEFTPFVIPIVGSGSTLDLRISISDLNAADEDVAFDNLLVTGILDGGVPPDGDYNGDEVVNAADFPVFRDTFGTVGDDLPADGDGSGEIDVADFGVFAANFGNGGGVALTAQAATVPEPTSLLLVVFGLGNLARRRVG